MRIGLATAQVVLMLTLGLLLAQQLRAQDVVVAGVKYPGEVQIQDAKLQLNGAGVRYKAVFKVYAAALYATRKFGSLQEMNQTPGPKRLVITMLREIDATELGKLFSRGIEDNLDRATYAQLIPGILRMGQLFAEHKKLLPGETLVVDWVPGQGMLVQVKGQPQGEPFKEPEFFAALMSIWLGKSPADSGLKNALLGVKN